MVNVIMPVWHGRDTLPKALDSLVAQTKKMFLVTIVQDCDGEDYKDIIEEYKNRGLHIALLCTPENGGPGAARQYGMDHNVCDYIMFLDADDMYMPQTIEVLQHEIQTNLADVAMSDLVAEVPHQPSIVYPAQTSPVQWCHGKIYRAQYLRDRNIRFLPDLRLNEDSYFNLVAFNATEKKLRIPRELYLWRYNEKSLTRDGEKEDKFFHNSWALYVKSQVRGLQKLYSYEDVELNDALVGATMLNIYNHIMKAIHLDEDQSVIDEYMKDLAQLEPLWEQLTHKDFWLYIDENVKCTKIDGESIYFYKFRFIDWIKKIGELK